MSESLTAKVQRMSVPVNRAAAQVIRPGIKYEDGFVAKSEIVSEYPLPTRPYPLTAKPEDNLAGWKTGRFTVIGLGADCASWVVKCSCGRYLYRKARALKKASPEGESNVMCPHCVVQFKKKTRTIESDDQVKKNLHAAALPLYRVVEAVLNQGVTPEIKRRARAALAVADGRAPRESLEDMHDDMGKFREHAEASGWR